MRHAHQDVHFLTEDDATVLGISFGHGGCAEHESGVRLIKAALGFVDKGYPIGIEDRIIPALNDSRKMSMKFIEKKTRVLADPGSGKKTMTIPSATLAFGSYVKHYDQDGSYEQKYIAECIDGAKAPHDLLYKRKTRSPLYDQLDTVLPQKGEYGYTSDRMIVSQWDEKNAVITVFGKARVEALRSLYEAFLEGTATLSLSGSSNPFGRGSLCLCDASKLSEGYKESILAADLSYKAMWDKVNATGIIEALEKGDKGYYALSPRINSDGNLVFFLNPRGQSEYNSGWFDEGELRQWIEEKGPICKRSQAA